MADQYDVDIMNIALRRVGAEPTTLAAVNAVPPTGKAAALCAFFLPTAKALVLGAYSWRAARKRARLTTYAGADDNLSGLPYRYTLPADYLSLVDFQIPGVDWQIEGQTIYADLDADTDGNPVIVYTADIASQLVPVHLKAVIGLRLALFIRQPLTADKALEPAIQQEYFVTFNAAKAADARGGATPPAEPSSWTDV